MDRRDEFMSVGLYLTRSGPKVSSLSHWRWALTQNLRGNPGDERSSLHQPGKASRCYVPSSYSNLFLTPKILILPLLYNSTPQKHAHTQHKPSKHSLSGFWRFIKRVVLGRWLWTSDDSAPVVWPTSSTLPPVRCPRVLCTVCVAWQRISVGRLKEPHTSPMAKVDQVNLSWKKRKKVAFLLYFFCRNLAVELKQKSLHKLPTDA